MNPHYTYLLMAGLLLVPARAQQMVAAKEGYDAKVVVAVKEDDTPMVLVGSKVREAVKRARLFLKPGATYHDAQFTITEFKMKPAGEQGQVLITATVTPDRPVARSFVAVEVRGSDGRTESVRVTGLPAMNPAKPATYAIQVPGKPNRKSKTRPLVHYFAGALEVIHSEMTPAEISAAKAKRDEFTLKKTQDRPVTVVYAVPPSYPEALRETAQGGTAKVQCRIGLDGRVIESKLKEASAPEFGEAAVNAVQDWLFAPAIKNGRFIEAEILVPIDFSPPKQ